MLPDRWPRAGLSDYVFYNADSPALLTLPGWDLDEPTATLDPASGGIVIFGRMAPASQPAQSQLFWTRVSALDEGAVDGRLELALEPTLSWEGRGLSSPSIADLELPLLFYQGEDGSVGLCLREGDGTALKKVSLAAPLASAALLGGGGRVGRAFAVRDARSDGSRIRLYYTVDDLEVYVAEAAAQDVVAISQGRGASVAWQVRALGLRAASFRVPPGDTQAMPAEHIAQLSARRQTTPVGRERWDLFVSANLLRTVSLIAASAYAEPNGDEHFVAASAPLIKTQTGTLSSPTLTTFRGRPLLLVGLRQVRTSIAAAVLP